MNEWQVIDARETACRLPFRHVSMLSMVAIHRSRRQQCALNKSQARGKRRHQLYRLSLRDCDFFKPLPPGEVASSRAGEGCRCGATAVTLNHFALVSTHWQSKRVFGS